jgi:cytochrome P450
MTTIDDPTLTIKQAGLMMLDSDTYVDEAKVRAASSLLRETARVHYVEHPDFLPVWMVTRHRDVREIELHNKEFLQGPYPFLQNHEEMRAAAAAPYPSPRMLIHMDGSEHKAYRNMTAGWFTPKNLSRLEGRLAELARRAVDGMAGLPDGCDFAQEVAASMPLQVILSILGLPESDYSFLRKLSQQQIAPHDAELAAGTDPTSVMMAFFDYFSKITADRRANPTDDLASVVANAKLPGGDDVGLGETIGYYVILAVAGHDTTSSSMASGLQALIEHPEQLARLQAEPELIPLAADEMIRWATPVKHFTRTAAQPYRLGDHDFAPGDVVFMSYASANFDPQVFHDPLTFDVGRTPNEHLAFGFGAHFCLGAQLARMEIRALLTELVPRIRSIELAGTPELVRGIGVGGMKHLPIRYELR